MRTYELMKRKNKMCELSKICEKEKQNVWAIEKGQVNYHFRNRCKMEKCHTYPSGSAVLCFCAVTATAAAVVGLARWFLPLAIRSGHSLTFWQLCGGNTSLYKPVAWALIGWLSPMMLHSRLMTRRLPLHPTSIQKNGLNSWLTKVLCERLRWGFKKKTHIQNCRLQVH